MTAEHPQQPGSANEPETDERERQDADPQLSEDEGADAFSTESGSADRSGDVNAARDDLDHISVDTPD